MNSCLCRTELLGQQLERAVSTLPVICSGAFTIDGRDHAVGPAKMCARWASIPRHVLSFLDAVCSAVCAKLSVWPPVRYFTLNFSIIQ
jgi:hypothetical protein